MNCEINEKMKNYGYRADISTTLPAPPPPLSLHHEEGGMIKPESYTKEPYPITSAELLEREEREAKSKEERLKAEFTAFVERMRKKSTNT